MTSSWSLILQPKTLSKHVTIILLHQKNGCTNAPQCSLQVHCLSCSILVQLEQRTLDTNSRRNTFSNIPVSFSIDPGSESASERQFVFQNFPFFTWTENIVLNHRIILSTLHLIFKDHERLLFKQRQEVFTFSEGPTPTLESFQPPVQWV